jgi:hypothetical protein
MMILPELHHVVIYLYEQILAVCLSGMKSYDRCVRINSMLCHVYDICSFVVKSASTYLLI